jgi:hypothetical protein
VQSSADAANRGSTVNTVLRRCFAQQAGHAPLLVPHTHCVITAQVASTESFGARTGAVLASKVWTISESTSSLVFCRGALFCMVHSPFRVHLASARYPARPPRKTRAHGHGCTS